VEFKWYFNNSAESIEVAANHIARVGALTSIVSYTPMTELDYGSLVCIATNAIGKQKQPCVFHIIAAGRPDQVNNCTISNISMTSLSLKCVEGFSGGLTQSFVVEIFDLHTQDVRANVSSPIPRFTINNLQPGCLYSVQVYAFNAKGRSEPFVIQAAMLRLPEKRSENVHMPKSVLGDIAPVFSLAIASALVLVTGSCILVLIVRCSCRKRRKELTTTIRAASPELSDKSIAIREVDENESDEKNPDIIPDNLDPDEQIGYIRRRPNISTIDASTNQLMLPHASATLKKYTSNKYSNKFDNITPYGYCTLRNGGSAAHNTSMVTILHLITFNILVAYLRFLTLGSNVQLYTVICNIHYPAKY